VRRPTIRDVAGSAGVSLATVSNVINGRNANVGEATRDRVLAAIKTLGYRTHATGRSLRLARRESLAFVVVDEDEAYLLDPFTANLVAGFAATANTLGCSTVLHGCKRADFEQTVAVKRLDVDGYALLLSGASADRRQLVERMAAMNQPLVLLQETNAPAGADACVVRQDDHGGGRHLAEHILTLGPAEVAILRPTLAWAAFEERERGLAETLGAAGVRTSEIICASERFDDVRAGVLAALSPGTPPAVIAALNDQMAIAAMKAVAEIGLAVPGDVAVTGFNAIEAWRYCTPNLTTVRSPAYELGMTAARALFHRLASDRFEQDEVVLPVTLMPSASTHA